MRDSSQAAWLTVRARFASVRASWPQPEQRREPG
jgi:hypothetical protein